MSSNLATREKKVTDRIKKLERELYELQIERMRLRKLMELEPQKDCSSFLHKQPSISKAELQPSRVTVPDSSFCTGCSNLFYFNDYPKDGAYCKDYNTFVPKDVENNPIRLALCKELCRGRHDK